MKNLFFTVIALMFLCSCSKAPAAKASFVHASGLDRTENGVKFSVLLEKQDDKENEFACISFEGETIPDAYEKFIAEYPECYTSSAQLCFLSETLSRRALYEAALFMCETPTFPSKTRAVSVSSVTARDFLENIKTPIDLKQIKNLCFEESPNLAVFFALCTSQNRTAKLCSFTILDDEVAQLNPVFYRNCAIMQTHYFEKIPKGQI